MSSTCKFRTSYLNTEINTIQTQHLTDHQLKRKKHTSDIVIFGHMSPKNLMLENRGTYSESLLLCNISLSTIGCLTGSPNREKYTAAIPLYLETYIQKTCPMKPSPAQMKLSASPSGLCISPRTLCVSPLRHCTTSRTLYVTPTASAWLTQSP